MLKFVDSIITFSEIPDEISLCINLSNCPHRCEGCHSSYLQEDIGNELNKEVLKDLIDKNVGITCVCFMGGDNDIPSLSILAQYVRHRYQLKTAWYTGLEFKPSLDRPICTYFDFIKTGPYIESLGPLNNPNTNQRMWVKIKNAFKDITNKFYERDL